MTNNQLTSTHLAVKSELDGYKIHASRGQATAMAMVRLFESIDRDLEELQERRKADSEPVELPLDYLQGHRDGLEWAAQLAEANHPETGDWLYDDPIELAKAIRKGPDMPPEQPVEDSEPDRNPVLAYADSYRDMAKQGVESVPIWSVITDLERNIAPLYRHAQPVPVVPNEIKHRIGGLDWGWEGEFNRGWNACRAAMLQAGTLTNEGTKQAWTGIPDIDNAINMLDRIDTLESCDDDRIEAVKTVLRGLAGNSPVIPDGYVMVPVEPTKEILDEFDSIIDYGVEDSVDAWHRLLAAAPQSPGSEPAKDDRDHQLCRRCNDGIRGGCSSCAYNVR
ncbi:hypothetical protein VSS22_01535 [Klebsiella pneumoniae]|uniref:hypothetical protein n=1 Tax=Klebsiella pneumoniae TaxID=573 RepID=UPI001EF98C47|nr:hypothetical protein [Klebsiella pneumoniae]MCP6217483.1 hypothetical protein [Klebsiella pneumoniae]MEC4490902.1 hypothetical protein [Klebsiella pneumoniae]